MKPRRMLWAVAMGIFAASWFLGAPCWGAPSGLSAPLERTILAGDWQGVLERCGSQEKESSPVRAVKAHALLALNRNDESLRLFLSLEDERHREAWHRWAAAFSDRVLKDTGLGPSSKAIAKYLEGDALARLGRWQEAALRLEEAVRLDRRCALAWNALGVAMVHGSQGRSAADLRKARNCFAKALDLRPDFADAHANLGVYHLMTGGSKGAREEFQRAVELSQEGRFSLARIGLACALLAQSGDEEALKEAAGHFAQAAENEDVRPLLKKNLAQLRGEGVDEAKTGADPKDGPGMSIKTKASFLAALPPDKQLRELSSMSTDEIMQVRDQVHQNMMHSAKSAGVFNFLAGVIPDVQTKKFGLKNRLDQLAASSREDASRWAGLNHNLNSISEKRPDLHVPPNGPGGGGPTGGVTTKQVSLEEATGDLGEWPARITWFALAPRVPLPSIQDF